MLGVKCATQNSNFSCFKTNKICDFNFGGDLIKKYYFFKDIKIKKYLKQTTQKNKRIKDWHANDAHSSTL